jgi:hypothetical protein
MCGRYSFLLIIWIIPTLNITFLSAAQLQQSDTTISVITRLELEDGSSLIGHVVQEEAGTLKMVTLSGLEVTIPLHKVVRREIIKGEIIEGKFWPDDPNSTRLLFAPTGKPLSAGQGYFSVYEIFFPFIAYGVTNSFTVAAGMTLLPGAESQAIYLAPKVTPLQRDNFDLSAGVLYIKIPDEQDAAGIVYGVSTYGNEKRSLTAGMGYGFAGGDFAKKPVFMLGGEIRASRSIKWISENWLSPGENAYLLSLGLRFFGERLAADFALMRPLDVDMDGFPFFPWIGFAYNFGKAKHSN